MSALEFSQLLGNYGEFIGAIAIVATLIYLAVQLKQNTASVRASAYQEWVTSNVEIDMGMSNPAQSEIVDKGNYDSGAQPVAGMQLARKIGMLSYRSALEWQQRFGRDRIPGTDSGMQQFDPEFQVESYLVAHANKFIGNFDANCYLYLSRSMDWFDCAEHSASTESALAGLKIDSALIVGVTTDFLFPVDQQEDLAKGIQASCENTTFVSLPSIEGHDSFLVDIERFGATIAEYFQ